MLFSIGMILIIMNADALCTGFIYGIKGIRISILSKLLMSACSIFYSYISILFGKQLAEILPSFFTQILGFSLLFLLGFLMILKGIRIKSGSEKYDFDKSKEIEPFEAVCLGLALSADCLSVGIGLSLLGINSSLLPPLMGTFQLLFLSAGILFGKKIFKNRNFNEKFITILAGSLLLLLALIQLFV